MYAEHNELAVDLLTDLAKPGINWTSGSEGMLHSILLVIYCMNVISYVCKNTGYLISIL